MMPQDKVFVGIDISSADLEISEDGQTKTWSEPNQAKGWARLIKRWRGRPVVVGVEPSGGYEQGLVRALVKAGIEVRWADPARVRHLAKALGAPAKTDPIDAVMVRLFVSHTGGRPVVLDADREALAAQLSARQTALETAQRLRQQAKALPDGPARQALDRIAALAEAELKALTKGLLAAIKAKAALTGDWALMQTAPGVGPLVALDLIATMPELGHVSGRAIAKLAGLAPFIRKSGKWTGQAKCSGGRPRPRRALYLAAMASLRAKKGMGPVFQALVARGKLRKVALVACMRKLLVTLNAMIANQTPWNPATA